MSRSVLGFLLFVVALVVAVGFVWPKANSVKSLGITEQAKKQISLANQVRFDSLTGLAQTFEVNATRVDAIVSILPVSPQIPEALVTVEAMARANGVSIQSLTPQLDTTKQQVVVTLVGDAEMAGVEGFIANAAENNRPISVSNLTLVKASEGNRLVVTFGLAFPYRDGTKVGSSS